MLPREQPDRIQIAFDDQRLVANAGLLLPVTLAHQLGLGELVDRHVHLGDAPGRANAGDKVLTLVALTLAATFAIIGCGGQISKAEPATNTPALMPDNREPVNVTPGEAATVWSRVAPSAQNTFCDNYHNFGAGLTVNDVDGNTSYDISEHLPDLCATLVTATPPAPESEQDSNQLDRDQIVQDFAVATVSVSPADACADAVQKNINVTRLYQEAHEPNYEGQTLSHMLFEGRGEPPFNRSDALTMATAYKQECTAAGYKYVRKLPTPTPTPKPDPTATPNLRRVPIDRDAAITWFGSASTDGTAETGMRNLYAAYRNHKGPMTDAETCQLYFLFLIPFMTDNSRVTDANMERMDEIEKEVEYRQIDCYMPD